MKHCRLSKLQNRADMFEKIFDTLIEWGQRPESEKPGLWTTNSFTKTLDQLITLLKYVRQSSSRRSNFVCSKSQYLLLLERNSESIFFGLKIVSLAGKFLVAHMANQRHKSLAGQYRCLRSLRRDSMTSSSLRYRRLITVWLV